MGHRENALPSDEAVTRLRFDFPHLGEREGPLVFEQPSEIIVANDVSQVRGALARADLAARAGKWVAGFVCYEAGAAFDAAFRFHGRSDLPLVWFGVFDEPISAVAQTQGAAPPFDWALSTSRPRYDRDIAAILEHIRAGDVYQVNHTVRLAGRYVGDWHTLYSSLREKQATGYCACIELGRHRILSVSPELFFSREDSRVTFKPMKGTARRGASETSDRALRESLATAEKERAENLMIVDLIRNDLSRIAEPHSVTVPSLFSVERYPTVWQMTSTVTAEIAPEIGLEHIFAATFPCGSITGAPKIEAMKIIAELESGPRGIYCGAIGVLRPGGDAVFNVAIRTLAVDTISGSGQYGVGGGITADSLARNEYDEVLAKCLVVQELSAID
ncbi:aminodeoxychorismate synthase component I [Aromatoleum toluolicum]|uniref:Aminodeoxychorismate synthase component I n=1 Tax=Aromatoleum toluolicum TaxID=90060 RepID=A0ABX1NPL1_9RHOO|nr:aminodeoxychorismate synthase component I [Aromatoleum toluolicum]NMG00974.1 aminodeoxychorismate synthase component I [Aromatoleum toluolicum]